MTGADKETTLLHKVFLKLFQDNNVTHFKDQRSLVVALPSIKQVWSIRRSSVDILKELICPQIKLTI